MDSTRVGQFSPMGDSPYKCVDMVGNIWEWCSDWYREEEYAERVKSGVIIKNPQGPASGITHTIRGGSFGTGRAGNRCADRMGYIKHLLQDKLGFRIALSII